MRLNPLIIGLGIVCCCNTAWAKPHTVKKAPAAKVQASAIPAKEFHDSQKSTLTLTPSKLGVVLQLREAGKESGGQLTLNKREAAMVGNLKPEAKIGTISPIEHKYKDASGAHQVILSFLGAPEGMVVLTITSYGEGGTQRQEFDMNAAQHAEFLATLRAMSR